MNEWKSRLAAAGAGGWGAQLDEGSLNLGAELAAMSEAGLHDLRTDLAQLDAEVSAELRRTLADNYQPFILASQVGLNMSGRTISIVKG